MPQSQLIPQLIVIGGSRAMDFYKQAFGATEVARTMTPDGKKLVHGELSFDGALLFVSDEFDPTEGGSLKSPHTLGGTAVRITLYADDADKAVEQAVRAGAEVLMPVQDMFWGGRYGKLLDPFGHEWGVNQKQREQTEAETQQAADQFFKDRR